MFLTKCLPIYKVYIGAAEMWPSLYVKNDVYIASIFRLMDKCIIMFVCLEFGEVGLINHS